MGIEERITVAVGAALIAFAAAIVSVVVWIFAIGFSSNISGVDSELGISISLTRFSWWLPVTLWPITAMAAGYLLWEDNNATWRRAWLYFISVSVIGGFSLANYSSWDTLVSFKWQFVINFWLLIASIISISLLWSVPFTVIEAKVVKYAAIAVPSGAGIIAPILFNLVYIAVKLTPQHDKHQSLVNFFTLGKETVLLICSVGGFVIALLKYLDDKKDKSITQT